MWSLCLARLSSLQSYLAIGVLAVAAIGTSSRLVRAGDGGAPDAEPSKTCTLQSGGYRTVARIIDGETLLLDDGREVRLIGALAPRAADAGAASGSWPIETESVRALTALVLGRTIKIAFGDRRTDRYGRHLAHVFVGNGQNEKWVQGELLAAGAARAYGLPGLFNCSMELLAHERAARIFNRGLWNIALYRMKPAHMTGLLMKRRSSFEIVTGIVASVSNTKSAVYLNFGTDWKTDFTARIAKDVLAAHPEFATSLSDRKSKRVAVRGWIERRNGPLIDIRHPDQIELLDSPDGAPILSQSALPKPVENTSTPPRAVGAPLQDGADMPDNDPSAGPDTGADTGTQKESPAEPSRVQPGAVDL